MAVTNDGAIYGVTNLKYNGVNLGLISEDGCNPAVTPQPRHVFGRHKNAARRSRC